jgi:hypothetical protein
MPVKNRNMVTAPKKRLVGKQPHLLAYITPAEAALLKKNGGTGEMVDGIPAFRKVTGRGSFGTSTAGTGFDGGYNPFSHNDDDNDGPSAAEIAAANAAAAAKVARELEIANAVREKAAAEAKAVADLAAANAAREKAALEAQAVADAAKAAEAKAIADQAAIDAAALATSPTGVSNVYDFYETDPVVGYTADDLNLGIGAVAPVTTTTSPTDDSNVYSFYEPDISLDAVSTTTYPAPPPDPIFPDDRDFDWYYGPTPFEGPATDDELGLTDAPISDYVDPQDPYEPNLLDPQTDDDLGFNTYDDTDIFGLDAYDPNIMDYQTNDDLGFEDTLDTTDIFGPNVDLIQDPDTGYVRPMTVQELEQGAFDTRLSYAAPDNVLDPNIGTLDPSSFSTGATETNLSAFGGLLGKDYTGYSNPNFTGYDRTTGGNTIGISVGGDNVNQMAIVNPDGSVRIADANGKNTGVVFSGVNAVQDAVDHLSISTGGGDTSGDGTGGESGGGDGTGVITGTSPTDTANVYDYYNGNSEVDPYTDTTDFNIGGFDTGPNVDTTAPSGLTGSTDLLGDPINFGAVPPTDLSNVYDFYNEPDSVIGTNTLEVDKTAPNAGFTDATGVGTETPSVTGASPSGYNSLEDASDYNQSFDPTGVSDPTGLYSPTDLDLGIGTTGLYSPTDLDLGTGTTVSTTTVSPTDLSNVYDFYNEPAANPLSLELTDPASGLDYADGSPNNIANDDAVASIVIGRDLDNADEPVLNPDTGKPMLTDKGKPITYGVAPRFSGGGFAGFIQDLISFVVKGATYGVIDINKMDEKYKEKLWDAYQAGGTWAYDEKGKIVGITDENGKLLNIGGGGADVYEDTGNDNGIVDVCEPGYILVNGVCVPEDGASTGAEGRYGGTFAGPIIRPTTPRTPRTPVVTPPTLPAPTIRAPKQFAMGGEVSPGLVTAADRFLASLKG